MKPGLTSSLPPEFSRVAPTAWAELEVALRLLPHPPAIELTTLEHAPTVLRERLESSIVSAGDRAADPFCIGVHEDKLYVIGVTPRGLLQGVFQLHEEIRAGTSFGANFCRAGAFRPRQRIFHARFQPWPGGRSEVRFLAHMGATHCLVSHDWQGHRRSLQGYVTSPVFPNAVDRTEVASNHAGLRQLIDHGLDYGIEPMLWLTELPCQGGPWVPADERERFLERYDRDVLSDSGTYEGRVLCFGHERVRSFYRDLLHRFFADFPEVGTLFIFGQDSGGEFCDPDTCPRCRGVSRFEQRDRLIRFLIEEGQKVRAGLRVLTTGWHWDRMGEEFLRRQASLPPASGAYFAAQTDGWQCERQAHDFMREVRATCAARGQSFIGYDNFHWGDDTVHGLGDIQDFPLGIGAKLRRWDALAVDGVFDHWGNAPEEIWNNSIACRDFFLEPNGTPVDVATRLARRQYGDGAAAVVVSAWEELEKAHVQLNPVCTWPPAQWPMWYGGRNAPPIPPPEVIEQLRRTRNPPRADGAETFNPPELADAFQRVGDAWRAAWPHYQRAAALLESAAAMTNDSPLFYSFWWDGPASTPTRCEHLSRQARHAASMAHVGRELGIQFELYAAWTRARASGQAEPPAARALLAEDAIACRAAAGFFRVLGKPKDWAQAYGAKADGIDAFLAHA